MFMNSLVWTMFLTSEGAVASVMHNVKSESYSTVAASLAMLNFLHQLLVLDKQS